MNPGTALRFGKGCALMALLLLSAGCAPPAARGSDPGATPSPMLSAAASTEQPARNVALIDYHQHLVSSRGADWLYQRRIPDLELPEDLGRVVRQRAERWNDRNALAELYTAGSAAFTSTDRGADAVHGRDSVAEFMSTFFGRPLRLMPFGYSSTGSEARIAGYLTRGEGRATRHFGHFFLGLERDGDGTWRIAVENLTVPGPRSQQTIDAGQLVSLLDDAGIQRAVVLSVAYWFDSAREPVTPAAYDDVRAENDWTAAEAARHPDRLVTFCSFNPLREHALAEIERCAANPHLKGVKLHFGSSGVDLRNAAHVQSVRGVFAAANRLRLPLVVHVRGDATYGSDHVAVLLNEILPAAPDVVVQVAHLWGGEAFSAPALATFADAVSARHPSTRNLYFDVSDAAAVAGGSAEVLQTLASRIRQIGLDRILYGSDAVGLAHPAPREAWAQFRRELPLTEEEFRVIASNVAPYMR
jgi:predicted TIM-barrel fold metal-dependent hydrolase